MKLCDFEAGLDQPFFLIAGPCTPGDYRELFEQIQQWGFLKVRIDGEIKDIKWGLQADRYKTHDIEIVIDHIQVSDDLVRRITDSISLALKYGKGSVMILEQDQEKTRHFSQYLMCPTSGISYDEPAPNNFSFNSPYGACKKCNGLGTIPEIDQLSVIPDKKLSIKQGAILPLGTYKDTWIFSQILAIGKKYGFNLNTRLSEIQRTMFKTTNMVRLPELRMRMPSETTYMPIKQILQ